jgi:hypothetical protein
LVHVDAIGVDFGHGWPAQNSSLNPGPTGADRVVIGVKQDAEFRVEGSITWQMRNENECFKKPAGMSQVPFNGLASGIDWIT